MTRRTTGNVIQTGVEAVAALGLAALSVWAVKFVIAGGPWAVGGSGAGVASSGTTDFWAFALVLVALVAVGPGLLIWAGYRGWRRFTAGPPMPTVISSNRVRMSADATADADVVILTVEHGRGVRRFETLVSGMNTGLHSRWYGTRADALDGHEQTVNEIAGVVADSVIAAATQKSVTLREDATWAGGLDYSPGPIAPRPATSRPAAT